MPAPSKPLRPSVDPAPRPFGRVFWLCIGAATLLILVGALFFLMMAPSARLHPRHPGPPPVGEPAAAPAVAPAASTPRPALPAEASEPAAPPTTAAPSLPPPSGPPAQTAKILCSEAAVSSMVNNASRQFHNGDANAALTTIGHAIACKADVQTYRLAASFACAAHDEAAANLYFHKLPEANQPEVRKACREANVSLTEQ